jgi:hypothetical protein
MHARLAAEGRGGRVLHDQVEHGKAARERVPLPQRGRVQRRQAIRRAGRRRRLHAGAASVQRLLLLLRAGPGACPIARCDGRKRCADAAVRQLACVANACTSSIGN